MPLKCIIVTPEQTVDERTADFVALPLYDGELGVAPGHTPMIGRLGYGELRIVEGGVTTRYFVDGGFAEVADNVVSVLTNNAVPAGKVDSTKAQAQLEAAKARPATTPELLAIRERDQLRARAQIRVAAKK
jgi:F-type H+-transporting ATPase subunit epsilon